MHATDLAPALWNAILERIDKAQPRSEYVFAKVLRRDPDNGLIWTREFGSVPIPLVAHTFGFSYYDTQSDGVVQKRADLAGEHVKIVTPKKGSIVVIVKPYGNLAQPFCIGVVESKDYWGEGA